MLRHGKQQLFYLGVVLLKKGGAELETFMYGVFIYFLNTHTHTRAIRYNADAFGMPTSYQ